MRTQRFGARDVMQPVPLTKGLSVASHFPLCKRDHSFLGSNPGRWLIHPPPVVKSGTRIECKASSKCNSLRVSP